MPRWIIRITHFALTAGLLTLALAAQAAVATVYLPLTLRGSPPPAAVLPVGSAVRLGTWRATVTAGERVPYLTGNDGPLYPQGVFIVALVEMENLGYRADELEPGDLLLGEASGRRFDPAGPAAQQAAQDAYGRTGAYVTIQPGFVEPQVYLFDVPREATGLALVAGLPAITPTPNPPPLSIIPLGTAGQAGPWEYTVTEVVTTATLTGAYGPVSARGTFLVVLLTLHNRGSETDYLGLQSLTVQDSAGRQFDLAEMNVQWAGQGQFGRSGVYTDLAPGASAEQVYVFDILPATGGLYLLPSDPGPAVDLDGTSRVMGRRWSGAG